MLMGTRHAFIGQTSHKRENTINKVGCGGLIFSADFVEARTIGVRYIQIQALISPKNTFVKLEFCKYQVGLVLLKPKIK